MVKYDDLNVGPAVSGPVKFIILISSHKIQLRIAFFYISLDIIDQKHDSRAIAMVVKVGTLLIKEDFLILYERIMNRQVCSCVAVFDVTQLRVFGRNLTNNFIMKRAGHIIAKKSRHPFCLPPKIMQVL